MSDNLPDPQQQTTAALMRHYFLANEALKREYIAHLASGRTMGWIMDSINNELAEIHPNAHRSSFSSLRKAWVHLGLPTQSSEAMAALDPPPSLDLGDLFGYDDTPSFLPGDSADGPEALERDIDRLEARADADEREARAAALRAAAAKARAKHEDGSGQPRGTEGSKQSISDLVDQIDAILASDLLDNLPALDGSAADLVSAAAMASPLLGALRHATDDTDAAASKAAPARQGRKSRAAPAWLKEIRKNFRPPRPAPKRQEDVSDIIAKELASRRARIVLGELVLSRASTVENVAKWLKERFEREHPKARRTSVKRIMVLWREAGLPVRGRRGKRSAA